MVVVLPAPFGPRNPRISPRSTLKLTSLTAVNGAVLLGEVLHLDHSGMPPYLSGRCLVVTGAEWHPRSPDRPRAKL